MSCLRTFNTGQAGTVHHQLDPISGVATTGRHADSGDMNASAPYLHWPPGLHRTPGGSWINDDKTKVTDPESLARLRALAIPPAWRHVWAASDADARVQARGIDSRGRVQYRYSEAATRRAAADRFDHMLHFAHALPTLRDKAATQLRRRPATADIDQLTALAVRILDLGLLRVGNDRYARDNHTYGLTTLEAEHVQVDGQKITFDFVGKEHVRQVHSVEDTQAARVMDRQLRHQEELAEPGPLLCTVEPPHHRVASSTVNTYIHAATGSAGSAKVFRTWGATVIASAVLAGAASPTTAKHRDPTLYAFDAAAAILGNTPTMARNSYVHPKALEIGTHSRMQSAVELAAQKAGTESVGRLFVDPALQATALELLEESL